ncbi:beta-1:3-galactosyltransferase 1-like protein, partial [Leptotrombidium deliense]
MLAMTKSNKIQQNVLQENYKHQDLIQASFIDNYYNLTLKSVSVIKWMD